MSLSQQMRLVALDLEEVVTAFFHRGPAQLSLTVQGIGRDQFAIQRGEAFQQGGGGGLFATLGALFPVINGDGLGRAVLVLAQGQQADMIPNHLAVQGRSLRQTAGAAASVIRFKSSWSSFVCMEQYNPAC